MRLLIIFYISFFSFQSFSQNAMFSLEILTDNFPTETYWILEDENGNIIDQISAGDLICSNTYYNWDIIVDPSFCYTFTIHDSYGDGICCSEGNGSYTINYDAFSYSGGTFHYDETVNNICASTPVIGCTDPNASNYNSLADTNIVFGGVIDPFFGSGGYFTGNQYLIFDAFIESKIISAVIYTQTHCPITFELRDDNGNIIEDTTANVMPGGHRIYFDFNVPVGTDYQLGISGNNPGMYRNNDQTYVNYPYDFAGLISIHNSSVGAQGYAGYYYFFYDIEVEASCLEINSDVMGCNDSLACNYNNLVTIDDGSCIFPTDTLINVTSCDDYYWNITGQTYTSSGQYIDTSYNASGCYEISVLDLVVNTSDLDSLIVTSCDDYYWNITGQTYTSSGQYIDTSYNASGCYEISVLDLVVNSSDLDSLIVTSCDDYYWNITGQTYTSSGQYIDTSYNASGCYEISVLDLVVNSSDLDTTVVVAGGYYSWNGISYYSSGLYVDSLINNFGCDSLIVLDLTVTPLSDFSPTVSVSLSNTYCDSLSDLTIMVSQDSGEVDMSSSLFQSNVGSFDIASLNNGDTIGTANLFAGGGTITLNTYIMVSQVVNSSQAIITACDSLQGCLGTFTISNTSGGGVSIFANAIFDGNNYTSGNMSSITFENLFINPCGILTFTTSINSELGQTDVQSFDINIVPAFDFSPTVSVSLSNTYCDSLSDLTIMVSQDSGEVDMSSSLFQSNVGSFDIASLNNGDTIGTANLFAGGGTITLNTYIMVSQVVNSSQAIITACDSLQGCLGTFTISNTSGGGVSIFANAIFDGNNYTSGNMSSITFENLFINPCGILTFTTSINSELGQTDVQSFDFTLSVLSSNNNFLEIPNKSLVRIVDLLGRNTKTSNYKILLYIYDDGSVERKVVIH